MGKKYVISRRSFLKKSAITVASIGFSGSIFNFFFSGLTPVTAAEINNVKKFLNACPRNCYDTCSIVSTVADGVLKKVEGEYDQFLYPRKIMR